MARTTVVSVSTVATPLPTAPLPARTKVYIENRSGGLAAISYDSTISAGDFANAMVLADGDKVLINSGAGIFAVVPAGTGAFVVSEME